MADKSYFRMENAANALTNCVCTMNLADDFEYLDLGSSEKQAYLHLRDLCMEFLEEYDRLSATMHTVAE